MKMRVQKHNDISHYAIVIVIPCEMVHKFVSLAKCEEGQLLRIVYW